MKVRGVFTVGFDEWYMLQSQKSLTVTGIAQIWSVYKYFSVDQALDVQL